MDFLPRLGTVTSGFALLVSMLALLKQEVCKQQVCVRVQDKGKRWWNAGTWGRERRGRQTGPGQLLLHLHTQGLPGQGPRPLPQESHRKFTNRRGPQAVAEKSVLFNVTVALVFIL